MQLAKPIVALSIAAWLAAPGQAQSTWFVDGACGDDDWSGLSPMCVAPDGPKRTIQAAMDLGQTGDTVQVADGLYTGPGNKNLHFPGGSNFTLRSEGGSDDCIIDLEHSGQAFFLVIDETPQAVIQGFTIRNGLSSMGGAIYLHHMSEVTISRCVFEANTSTGAGGAILADTETSPTLIDCRFTGNTAATDGGALAFFNDSSSPRIIDCELTNNTAGGDGGAIFLFGNDSVDVTNTTIAGNIAGGQGGGLFNLGISDVTITSSILWGNSGNQIDGPGGATATFTDVQGSWPGTGNLDADPLFVDLSAGDVRLLGGSPAIDAGDPAPPALPPFDALGFGHPRLDDGDFDDVEVVDMGAIEFGGLVGTATASVGQGIQLTLWGRPSAQYFAFVGNPGGPFSVGPAGTIFLAPAPLFLLASGALPPSGTTTVLSFPAPAFALGLDLGFQALTLGPAAGQGLHATNLQEILVTP